MALQGRGRSTLGSRGADTRGWAGQHRQGGVRKRTLLSVQADFTFLSFQGALRIAIKAPGLIAEHPIWILALSPLSLLSFRSHPIPLPACWLGACSFLPIITILRLLLIFYYFFFPSIPLIARFQPRAPPARRRFPWGRTRGAPGAAPRRLRLGPGPEPGHRQPHRPRQELETASGRGSSPVPSPSSSSSSTVFPLLARRVPPPPSLPP